MLNRSNPLFAALTAALLLAVLVGTASANRLSNTEARFRITYTPMTFIGGGQTITCNVTLEGSYHERTLGKVTGSLIGYVNRSTFASCNPGGAMRANTETLPWHVQYARFEGTLPTITGITKTLNGWSFEIKGEIFGFSVNCRYTVPSQGFIDHREALGVTRTQTIVTQSIRSEAFGCPELSPSGTGNISTPTGGTIAVRLI